MASTTYIYTVKNASSTNLTPACVLYGSDKETVLQSGGQTEWRITNTIPSALSPCYISYDGEYYKIESSDWIPAGGTTYYVNIDNQTPEGSGDSSTLGKIYLGDILISSPPTGSIEITENGTVDVTEYATAVVNVSGGGGSFIGNDVYFYDYDGTVVARYSSADFATLSELPAGPSHTGLTFQGWNWSLSDAKTYVATYGKLNIGAMYITSDGKTKLYISIVDTTRMDVPLYWQQSVAKGVVIDWGDGSATQTFTGTGNKNTIHSYSAVGDYVISFTVNSGTLGLGNNSNSYCVLGPSANNANTHSGTYRNMLKRVELGDNINGITAYAFQHCYSLSTVTIPSGTHTYNYSFQHCYSIVFATIPDGVTGINNSSFYYCYSLVCISIPKTVKSLGASALYYCSSLRSLTIPDGVLSMTNLYFCYSLKHITIPSTITVISSSAFQSCYSLSSIHIPSGVTSIAASAFYDCRSLESITIPGNVTNIENSAFNGCYSLASVTIPNKVTSIGSSAFSNCYSLKYIYLLSTTPPTLSNKNAFTNIASDAVIYVPSASVATYKAATNWSTYSSKIQAIP